MAGRVQLASHAAPRLELLRQLAALEGFELETHDLPRRPISLRLEDAELATVLAHLLDDVSYSVDYRHDPELRRNRIARLSVGARSAREERDAPAELGDLTQGIAEPGRRAERGSRAQRPRRVEPPIDEEHVRVFEALESPDPRERVEAVLEVDTDGEGLYRLLEMMRNDPDPDVRVAIVNQLEDSETHAAVEGLLDALGDPDRQVVLATIAALEFAGDETTVRHLEPLLEHPDREVREAAGEAIEFLE